MQVVERYQQVSIRPTCPQSHGCPRDAVELIDFPQTLPREPGGIDAPRQQGRQATLLAAEDRHPGDAERLCYAGGGQPEVSNGEHSHRGLGHRPAARSQEEVDVVREQGSDEDLGPRGLHLRGEAAEEIGPVLGDAEEQRLVDPPNHDVVKDSGGI